MAVLDDFVRYSEGLYHCRRCHRLVDTYDALEKFDPDLHHQLLDLNEAKVATMLAGHLAVNCCTDVTAAQFGPFTA
jgi:hypothetical protein